MIAPGMWAALAVTDRNPFVIPNERVHEIKVQ